MRQDEVFGPESGQIAQAQALQAQALQAQALQAQAMLNQSAPNQNAPSNVAGFVQAGEAGRVDAAMKKTVLICETLPITAAGLRSMLETSQDLEHLASVATLEEANEAIRTRRPNLVILDKSLGIQAVLEWIGQIKRADHKGMEMILWGVSITEAEALRFLQAGAKGIVRKTSDPETLMACLTAVAAGSSWMADSVFRETSRLERYSRSELTPREQQVMELVEQGLKNKEIAKELGIRPGTVKIHLKHIFEKTGVRGRYGLALSVMKEKGVIELSQPS